MNGLELKQLADEARLTPSEVCAEADISLPTLYKVYNDQKVNPMSKLSVEEAIRVLRKKLRISLAAG